MNREVSLDVVNICGTNITTGFGKSTFPIILLKVFHKKYVRVTSSIVNYVRSETKGFRIDLGVERSFLQ